MNSFILFVFGAAIGSFLNVVALRYDPDKFLLSPKVIGGRSHCPHCHKTLRWFELIPLVSFALQGAQCRNCHAKVSFRYPLIEIVSGLIFVFVPARLATFYFLPATIHIQILSALWVLVFESLLLMSLIDARLSLIPDEINIFLIALGVGIVAGAQPGLSLAYGSFLKGYAMLFYFPNMLWVNHLFGAGVGLLIFGGIILATRGRGMGLGDVKLAVPLGLIFGWPDILIVSGFSFVIGSVYGLYAMYAKGKHLKSALPFGPFLAIGAAVVFFFGFELVRFYFGLFLG